MDDRFLGEVDHVQCERQIVRGLVAQGEVELLVLVDELRHAVGARSRALDLVQEIVAPVVHQAGGEAVILVHQRQIRGIAQALQGELIDTRVTADIVFDIALDGGVVQRVPEPGIAQPVLGHEFETVDRCGLGIERLLHAEGEQRIVGVRYHVVAAEYRVGESLRVIVVRRAVGEIRRIVEDRRHGKQVALGDRETELP